MNGVACMDEGGFPAAQRIGDDTVWITEDFTLWFHARAR